MFISFNNKFSNSNIMSTNESTHILLLQYMRIISRQQDTLINTINSMQQQNENLYSLISDLIRIQNDTSITRTTTRQQPRTHASTNRTRRTTINRPRTRMFFPSTLSGITERMNRTPRIVTHPPSMRVNIPGTVNQTTTTEDIINESFNNYNPISIRPSLFQIRRATRILEFRDISNTTHQICPIDREILINHSHEELGNILMHQAFPRLSKTPGQVKTSAPSVGENTNDILKEIGITSSQIEQLRKKNIIS